jgi:hypothetical protein
MTTDQVSCMDVTDEQVLAWEARRIDAQLNGDINDLGNLFSQELTYIHSSGYIDTYHSYLEKIKLGYIKYLEINCSNYRIQITTAAIFVICEMNAVAQVLTNKKEIHSVISTVWLPEDTDWKLRLFQSTEMDQALLAKIAQSK